MVLESGSIRAEVDALARTLMKVIATQASRKLFFSTLSELLREHFLFDRLCINLYDQHGEMLTYFTAAEGTIVRTLSPVRPAELSSTVAGHVIATRKPVIITDFAEYFSDSAEHPIAEAGLTATMAVPLILDDEIIATLHCSFAEKPDNLYDITSFLLELAPAVATCMGAIFTLEHLRQGDSPLPVQSSFSLPPDDGIICHSKAMREVMRRVDLVAKLNIPVLLLGETGTGKSLLAQDIHRRSLRKTANFVKVNCPSLPQTLFESELFGHVKGAFTGAAQKRLGRFELAQGGTLFLDEIGELTPEMQSKLLQVLEDSSFERVGDSMPFAVDVRIIAATNIDIPQSLAGGRLREDLFHRLSPCIIELPPLRERQADVPLLAAALAAQITAKLEMPPLKLSAAMLAPLRHYLWPGNVRELRNVITRLVMQSSIEKQCTLAMVESILADSSRFAFRHGDASFAGGHKERVEEKPRDFTATEITAKKNMPAKVKTLQEVEYEHILLALEEAGGVIAGPNGAASLLGVPRSTLQHRMRKLGIL